MTGSTSTGSQAREAWDSIASQFDEFVTPGNIAHGQEVIGRADVGPGTRFLDVAAGSGALSLPAARLGAEVTATDISPAMLECLELRARAESLTNLRALVMDGCALDFPAGSFDVVASQHGVSVFAEVSRGIAEMCRVARPGGQVIVAAFGPLPKAEPLGFFFDAVRSVAPDLPLPSTDPPPLPFQLADRDRFRTMLGGVGLRDVSVQAVSRPMPVESAAQLWNTVRSSNPIGAAMAAGLTAEQRDDALEVLAGMLRERSAGLPTAVLHTEINIGKGSRP